MNKLLINALLKENNMSFSELSNKLDIKRTTLYTILKQEKIPLQYLSVIAQVFQCTISDLFDGEQEIIVSGTAKYDGVEFNLDEIDDYSDFINLLSNKFGVEIDIKTKLSESEE
jgi:Predicted transcriptional regulators